LNFGDSRAQKSSRRRFQFLASGYLLGKVILDAWPKTTTLVELGHRRGKGRIP